MPGFHIALALDCNLTDIFTLEIFFDQLVRGAGDLELPDLAMTLHTAGDVDHITP